MNQQEREAWDFLDEVDEQQYRAASALVTSPEVDPAYMMATIDLAYGEWSRVSRDGHYMIMARLDRYI